MINKNILVKIIIFIYTLEFAVFFIFANNLSYTTEPISNLSLKTKKVGSNVNNPASNIDNGGFVAKSGEWIFYRNDSDNNYLYKMKSNGTEKVKLNSDVSININVEDEWVYYINESDKRFVYKIRTDGTEITKLNNEKSYCLNVIGENLYYTNGSYMLKMQKDGTRRTLIHTASNSNKKVIICRNGNTTDTRDKGDKFRFINVVGSWIYFKNENFNFNLYKVRYDGTNESDYVMLTDDLCWYVDIEDEWIYYTNLTDNCYLYKMDINGRGRTKLGEDAARIINVVDGWIYYSNKSDNGYLYKIKIDGTDRMRLNSDNSTNINILGDLIIYQNDSDNGMLYKINIDGSGRDRFC